jgi:hypothetical protein
MGVDTGDWNESQCLIDGGAVPKVFASTGVKLTPVEHARMQG